MEIFGFEVNHEYIIQYVEAVEHNSWTFEVHFDTFSVFQTVWGILYDLLMLLLISAYWKRQQANRRSNQLLKFMKRDFSRFFYNI